MYIPNEFFLRILKDLDLFLEVRKINEFWDLQAS